MLYKRWKKIQVSPGCQSFAQHARHSLEMVVQHVRIWSRFPHSQTLMTTPARPLRHFKHNDQTLRRSRRYVARTHLRPSLSRLCRCLCRDFLQRTQAVACTDASKAHASTMKHAESQHRTGKMLQHACTYFNECQGACRLGRISCRDLLQRALGRRAMLTHQKRSSVREIQHRNRSRTRSKHARPQILAAPRSSNINLSKTYCAKPYCLCS
jgi:hypothetical protein